MPLGFCTAISGFPLCHDIDIDGQNDIPRYYYGEGRETEEI